MTKYYFVNIVRNINTLEVYNNGKEDISGIVERKPK